MKRTLLLLEDDLQLSATIKQFLEHQGYEVICAYDGYAAEDIVYERCIDVMLLDVKVPHLNGFAFLKRQREQGGTTPAIFITSLNSVEDVEEGFRVGCDDYIRKPFALKELSVRIEALIKRSYGDNEDTIQIAKELFFYPAEMVLIHKGKRVPLKTKEVKLLQLLLQRSGKLVRYEEIFKAVWDYDEDPSSGSLRAYVKTLRAVLGKERIETVKNVGYRFVAE